MRSEGKVRGRNVRLGKEFAFAYASIYFCHFPLLWFGRPSRPTTSILLISTSLITNWLTSADLDCKLSSITRIQTFKFRRRRDHGTAYILTTHDRFDNSSTDTARFHALEAGVKC
jgi:hypothetical protein